MSAVTTLVGNATSDVEIRYSQAGKPVGSLTVAVSDRKKNPQTGEWEDGDVWFARCTIFGVMAEQVAASILKGTRVIATGRIRQESWTDKEGKQRTSVGVIIDEIGPSLRYSTAQVTRAQASQQGQGARTAPQSGDWVTSTPPGPQAGVQQWAEPQPFTDSEVPF